MTEMPRDGAIDSALAMKREPYDFIAKRCERLGSDVFVTRLMLRKTICMRGREAAEVFYDPDRFKRHGAAPLRLQKSLFGKGGVQTTDDEVHAARKEMFLALMTPERIELLRDLTLAEWRMAARKWRLLDRIVLYEETQELLTRAVCRWAGVPLHEADVRKRVKDLAALFDLTGAVGPAHWRSRQARRASERWIASVIRDVREGLCKPDPGSAADHIAWYRGPNGEFLDVHTAAVELLNVLRPTVAVSAYFVFIAHALHEHPEQRVRLSGADDAYLTCFVQEVRRAYPFFPAVPARVRQEFDWRGYRFAANTRVMLDLYGTNHDPRDWEAPDEFRPERFMRWDGSPYNFIPQGGGDHQLNHRCPGEWITIELMKSATRFLVDELSYQVPAQNLRIDRRRLPALPRSRFIISNVRLSDARS